MRTGFFRVRPAHHRVQSPEKLSTPETGQHPWDRFYAAQGKERVEKMVVTKTGKTVAPFTSRDGSRSPLATSEGAVETLTGSRPPHDSRAPLSPSALVRPTLSAPADAAVRTTVDWSSVPVVELIDAASQQRAQMEAEANRLREAWSLLRLLGIGLAAVLVAVGAFELGQLFVNGAPRAEHLQAEGERVAATVLRDFAAPAQPLRVQSVRAEQFARPARGRIDYDLLVTLELAAPLHLPAESNGAQAYLQLQRATADAFARVLAHPSLRGQPALQSFPALPPLYAVAHRSGERVVVRVPLEAERRGWRWELRPRLEQRHASPTTLSGEVLERLPEPRLIFNTPAGREEMRRRMVEARDYIIRVNHAATSTSARR